jgi:hypothetical protein
VSAACVQTLQVQLHTAVPAKTKTAPAAALTFTNKKFKIFIEQPHSFEILLDDRKRLVCLLLRALYGLKQSPLL